jgi:hypothetical protein
MNSASWFLKIPPQVALPGLPLDAPSMLHLKQFHRGGCQHTSLRIGTLGWWMVILNNFRKVKSLKEFDEGLQVLLKMREDKLCANYLIFNKN